MWPEKDWGGFLITPSACIPAELMDSSLSVGGTMAQQVPVQAIQVHQAPQQTSPSSDSSTDLTQTSSSGTGNWHITITLFCLPS